MNPPPPPPPPPPPHGDGARSSGLPPGNYDIFIVPPHSSGSGFLYLPSLQVQRNSFLAGVACATAVFLVWQIVTPILKSWTTSIVSSGGPGLLMMILGVGVASWAWGKAQADGVPWNFGPGAGAGGAGTSAHTGQPGANTSPPDPGPEAKPKPSWQRANTGPAGSGAAGGAHGGWEKAREETRKKEEERKKKEEEDKKAREAVWERAKAREKEAREREERERKAKSANDPYAASRNGTRSTPSSPKKHQQPTARTYRGTDDDEYSFRPYDKPRRPREDQTQSQSSGYSESSYAPSQSTSRTTPPPSMHRGPYSTKDPDKIVVKAVYSFPNAMAKLPSAKLVSGVGSVTDGLILRITTEGLFIDDDVRGVPQREWDVKAWTMKLVEVWCPRAGSSGARAAPSSSNHPVRSLFDGGKATAAATAAESDRVIETLLRTCKTDCISLQHQHQHHASNSTFQSADYKGLHALRASIRDQEGRRYVFVLDNAESWKVAVGLQRLRRGSQVRALAVSSMSASDTRTLLEGLGWK